MQIVAEGELWRHDPIGKDWDLFAVGELSRPVNARSGASTDRALSSAYFHWTTGSAWPVRPSASAASSPLARLNDCTDATDDTLLQAKALR